MSRHLLPRRAARRTEAVYVPVEPADPFTEAIRTGARNRRGNRLRRSRCRRAAAPARRLSRPLRAPPHRARALRRGLSRLSAAALGGDRARTPRASPGNCRAPIRWPACWWWCRSICSTRCWTPWRSRRRSPWRASRREGVRAAQSASGVLAEITIEYPVPAVALRAISRRLMADAEPDRPAARAAGGFPRGGERATKPNTGERMAHWQRRLLARYTRNLALAEQRAGGRHLRSDGGGARAWSTTTTPGKSGRPPAAIRRRRPRPTW